MANRAVFEVTGYEKELKKFITDNDNLKTQISKEVKKAGREAAKIINEKQKEIIKSKYPQSNLASLIGFQEFDTGKGVVKNNLFVIGYSGEAIRENPKTYVVEFGRPGISKKSKQRRRKNLKAKENRKSNWKVSATNDYDTLGRKIGDFKAYPHIVAGKKLVEEKAVNKYHETLFKEIEILWQKKH